VTPRIATNLYIIVCAMETEPNGDAALTLEEKHAALEFALQSESLGRSERLKCFLSYICAAEFNGELNRLTEYDIAVSALGRRVEFSPLEDSTVRSRAHELRQKLERLYTVEAPHYPIRIDLHKGSYAPRFHRAPQQPAKQPECSPATILEQGRWSWRRPVGISLIAVALLVTSLVTIYHLHVQHQQIIDSFWAPIMNAQRPVLIFIGARHTYDLSREFLDRYRALHHLENTGREFFIDPKKGDSIDESDLVPNHVLIGFGDVAATARMASMLTRSNKQYDLRYGNDIAVADLQSSPTILIGGFSNTWALELMHPLPFRLESGDRIVDMNNKARVWIRKSNPETFAGDDYAVISRLTSSETGNFVLIIAGIDTFSNQAAADFLDDPQRMKALLVTLPKDWEKKNLQFVLHTSVIKDVPSVVNVEAVNVW